VIAQTTHAVVSGSYNFLESGCLGVDRDFDIVRCAAFLPNTRDAARIEQQRDLTENEGGEFTSTDVAVTTRNLAKGSSRSQFYWFLNAFKGSIAEARHAGM